MDWGERKRTVVDATVTFYIVLWEVTEYLRTVMDKEVAEGVSATIGNRGKTPGGVGRLGG